MFHVSTLLPEDKDDGQYIVKKQHIGNDVVVIVFLDSSTTSFNPENILSSYNHVFFVVQPIQSDEYGREYLRLTITCKKGVSFATPILPKDSVFEKSDLFRSLFLSKCILFFFI